MRYEIRKEYSNSKVWRSRNAFATMFEVIINDRREMIYAVNVT